LVSIDSELRDAYGISVKNNVIVWRALCQEALQASIAAQGLNIVGGKQEVVVWDESVVGVHKGVNTQSNRDRSSTQSKPDRRNRVAERLPARTVFKGQKRIRGSLVLAKRLLLDQPHTTPPQFCFYIQYS
jgi:hypothetical protein